MAVETVTWTTLKSLLDAVPIDFSYVPASAFYYVYTSGLVTLSCAIPRDGAADVVDFETNYKPNAIDFFYTEINQYANLIGNATTTVKGDSGLLRAICINNNTTGGTVTVYDNTAASGTKIMTIQLGTPSGGLLSTSGFPSPVNLTSLDVRFNFGLTVVTAGSSSNNITVFYR